MVFRNVKRCDKVPYVDLASFQVIEHSTNSFLPINPSKSYPPFLSGLIDLNRWYNTADERTVFKRNISSTVSLTEYLAEARTISFHCSHMADRIIKLNIKAMSHGEAQIIRDVSCVLTAAPLRRSCQLSAEMLCRSDVRHMMIYWSIFPPVCDLSLKVTQ